MIDNALAAGKPIPDEFAERTARRAQLVHGESSLPENIRRLFPDEFQDSELGPIPKGWEVKPIGDVVRCVGGATPSTKNPDYWEGGQRPFVTPRDMSTLQSPVIFDSERHITDVGVEKISSKQLPAGTVLLSSRAPIGYLAFAGVPVSINQGIIAMLCDRELTPHYVYYWTQVNMEKIRSSAGGTTFAEISKRNFRPIPALVPPWRLLDAFEEQATLLFERIEVNTRLNNTLVQTRDILLARLMRSHLNLELFHKGGDSFDH